MSANPVCCHWQMRGRPENIVILGSMPDNSNEVADVRNLLWDKRWFSWVLGDPHQIMQQDDPGADDTYQW